MREIFLTFHGIGEALPGIERAERRYWWDKESFLLALDRISSAQPSSGLTVRITFDDGNMSDAKIALPALVKRGLTASFFICAGRIGKRGYLDGAAVRSLKTAGMAIGSHGMHHVDWRQLSQLKLDAEIADARHMLEDICGYPVSDISVPFGSYDRRVVARLRSEGYRCAYTSDGGTVRQDAWLKGRNTLDRSWQDSNVVDELITRNTFAKRLRRTLTRTYRALR